MKVKEEEGFTAWQNIKDSIISTTKTVYKGFIVTLQRLTITTVQFRYTISLLKLSTICFIFYN